MDEFPMPVPAESTKSLAERLGVPQPNPRFVRRVPMDFNGYVPVARAALRIRADEVQAGDILLVDGYVTRVDHIDRLSVERHGEAVKFSGELNAIRFPHELVSVIRPEPGWDPYLVTVVATDVDRRTSFRGEVSPA